MRINRLWLLSGGWLLIIVMARVLGGVPWPLLLGAVAFWALVVWGRRRWPRLALRPAKKGASVRGTIAPPSPRHAYKPATTLRALGLRLEDSGLGTVTVTPEGDSVRVALPEGEWARVSVVDPAVVTQATLALEGSSTQALALACDALAPELGAMRLEVDGVGVVIDGTRPRGLLERDVADAIDTRRRQQLAEQRRLEGDPKPPGPGPYLH